MRRVALVLALLAPLAAGGTGCDKLKQAQRESAESDSDEPSPKKKKKKKTADAAQSSASPRLSFETLSAAPVAPVAASRPPMPLPIPAAPPAAPTPPWKYFLLILALTMLSVVLGGWAILRLSGAG